MEATPAPLVGRAVFGVEQRGGAGEGGDKNLFAGLVGAVGVDVVPVGVGGGEGGGLLDGEDEEVDELGGVEEARRGVSVVPV